MLYVVYIVLMVPSSSRINQKRTVVIVCAERTNVENQSIKIREPRTNVEKESCQSVENQSKKSRAGTDNFGGSYSFHPRTAVRPPRPNILDKYQ